MLDKNYMEFNRKKTVLRMEHIVTNTFNSFLWIMADKVAWKKKCQVWFVCHTKIIEIHYKNLF